MATLYDVIIVGGGPAGLSGALVLGRCDRRVLVCDDGKPRNARSQAMHGFLTRDGTPPSEFLRLARDELKRYPSIDFAACEVTDVNRDGDQFVVALRDGSVLQSRKILLTTGLVDELPAIAGLAERWGSSVFPCPFCDAWEYRNQPMAVLGNQLKPACGFAFEMLTWTRDFTVLTHGSDEEAAQELERLDRLGVKVDRRRISALEGTHPKLEYIQFADGDRIPCAALFVLTSQRQRTPFAEKLGARLNRERAVRTDSLQHTGQRGIFAAGNASEGLQSAILAAAEGFKAAYAINDELIDDLIAERVGGVACSSPPRE